MNERECNNTFFQMLNLKFMETVPVSMAWLQPLKTEAEPFWCSTALGAGHPVPMADQGLTRQQGTR